MASRVDRDLSAENKIDKIVEDELKKVADHLLKDSTQTIPIDTGRMRDSGMVEMPTTHKAVVSFDTPYVVRQHEDMNLNHPNGGRAMWLSKTGNEEGNKYLRLLSQGIRRGSSR